MSGGRHSSARCDLLISRLRPHGRSALVPGILQFLRGTSWTSAGCIASISAAGCGGRHMKCANVNLSRVTSMTVKPFFSVGFNVSSMVTVCVRRHGRELVIELVVLEGVVIV